MSRTDLSESQRSSSVQGRKFEEVVVGTIEITDATIIDTQWKDPASKEEVDVIARTPDGVTFWVEAKGSYKKQPRGLRRSDTTKKAIATAWNLQYTHGSDRPPYLLVTTDLPNPGGVSELELENAVEAGLFTAVIEIDDLRRTIAALNDGTLS